MGPMQGLLDAEITHTVVPPLRGTQVREVCLLVCQMRTSLSKGAKP